MTIDDAINYYDERAKEYRANTDIKRDDYMDLCNNLFEVEQLASWLNELKLLRERVEKVSATDDTMNKIKAIIEEWQSDTWTDNLSYECMVKIAELVDSQNIDATSAFKE
jgi:hypothetical protein